MGIKPFRKLIELWMRNNTDDITNTAKIREKYLSEVDQKNRKKQGCGRGSGCDGRSHFYPDAILENIELLHPDAVL